MSLLLLITEFYIIDYCIKRRTLTCDILLLHFIATIENLLALLITIVIMEPTGSFNIRSCGAERLSDWYTLFFNPNPHYAQTLRCTQEAVFPLYSMIFLFYIISLTLLVIRPLLLLFCSLLLQFVTGSNHFKEIMCNTNATNTIYLTLYAIPALSTIHAIFCGLICK